MTQNNPEGNGWSRAEMYVMEELGRLSKQLADIDEKLTSLRINVARSGAVWGAISATVVSVAGFLLSR